MPTKAWQREAEIHPSTRPRSFYAEVARAPDGTNDLLLIRIPSFDDGEFLHGPCTWQARSGDNGEVLIPRVGSQCVVIDDEDGDLHVVVWWDPDATVLSSGGGAGALVAHQFIQGAAANPWIINHNLGRLPVGIETFDTGNVKVEGDVVHNTLNQTTITFSGVMAGKATYI